MRKKKVCIIGGGPAALTAAYFLSTKFNIAIYEKEKNVGQKFLVAGKGGFNLTNSLTGESLLNKYTPNNFLNDALLNFDSDKTREWLCKLGIETFVGTSGRVYAKKKHKPFQVLESIKKSLINKGVKFFTNYKFIGFDNNSKPVFESQKRNITVTSDFYIFALGGASWSITGSDGKWIELLNSIGVNTTPFEPSNCGINISWPESILKHHIGKPIKNVNLIIDQDIFTGEAVITEHGLEGNLVYSAISQIRNQLRKGEATIHLDFKPNNSIQELISKTENRNLSTTNYKKIINLNSTELAILKSYTTKSDFQTLEIFVNKIKNLKIKVNSLRPIDEAISTVGGIDVNELNKDFSLKKYPNFFTIGEMVDWDAPTGGYLLQACFSMGKYVADSLNSLEE